jgi:hypothetical protein
MKSEFRPVAALLAILAAGDLVMIPVMTHVNPAPPTAATILSGLLGIATLASIPGLAQGRRWAFWVAVASRLLDAANSALGVAFGSAAVFEIVGAITLVLSIAAIVLLARRRSRRAVAAASGA